MQILFLILSFILGTLIASFLGVIITRLRDVSRINIKSVLIGRSSCDHCQTTLSWRQLIPLGGYLLQRGNCKSCNQAIPVWMSRWELTLGMIFVAIMARYGIADMTRYLWSISALLWGLLVADLLYMEINLVLLGILRNIIVWQQRQDGILFSFTRKRWLAIFLIFLAIYGLGRYVAKIKFGKRQEWFGFGDVLVSIPIGLLLGQILWDMDLFNSLRWINIYILTASVSMLVYVILIKLFQKSWKEEVYFPFLVGMIASLVVILSVMKRSGM